MASSDRPLAAPVTFVLRPDWLGGTDWVPAVHNYLHAFDADEDCALWLAVEPSLLSLDEAVQLLRPILAQFGEARFPALSLSDDPREQPPESGRVVLSPAGPELVAWTPDRYRAAFRAARAAATGTPLDD